MAAVIHTIKPLTSCPHRSHSGQVSAGRLELPSYPQITSRSNEKPPNHHHVTTLCSNQIFNAIQSSTPRQQQETTDHTQQLINYTSKVEYGLKLGYTESQVQTALVKLGLQAQDNELLEELVKLGAARNNNATVTNKVITSTLNDSHLNHPACKSTIDSTSSTKLVSLCAPNVKSSIVSSTLSCSSCSLRPIVVDGSNVAWAHGKRDVFSCKGIQICVDYFRNRGHRSITVFVPMWRKEPSRTDAPITDQYILFQLEAEGIMVFTPSRSVNGRRVNCHDDRFILKLAAENGGVIVSNDNYRDLANENPEFKKLIGDRLLMYTFAGDIFMPPDDPLGRMGPSLDKFLMKSKAASEHINVTRTSSNNSTGQSTVNLSTQPCPYNKKCTYGNKCKYYHPERGNQLIRSVTDRMAEQARVQLQDMKVRSIERMKACQTASLPLTLHMTSEFTKRRTLIRTKSVIPYQNIGQSPPSIQIGNDIICRSNTVTSNLLHSNALIASPYLNQDSSPTPKFTSSSCVELLGAESLGHLNLSKRFSDPTRVRNNED